VDGVLGSGVSSEAGAPPCVRVLGPVSVVGRGSPVAVGGHTHERMVRRFSSLVFVNAGTLASHRSPCCAILDVAKAEVRFFELDDATAARPSEEISLR